jgi:hypothetical protein
MRDRLCAHGSAIRRPIDYALTRSSVGCKIDYALMEAPLDAQ